MPLVSEAVRGEGAVLIDETGVRFMANRPEWPRAELEPRDMVSRAVWARMGEGHRVFPRCAPGAWRRLCRAVSRASPLLASRPGVDPAVAPIPIRPAAHYHMGGIAVDADGRSTVPGLWACGEAACTGLHGANRLASNSLLEAAVTGQCRGAKHGRRHGRADARRSRPSACGGGRCGAGAGDPVARMRASCATRAGWRARSGRFRRCRRSARSPARTLGLMMAVAMQRRQESRGGHSRTDYPATPPALARRMTLTLDGARAYARAAPRAAEAGAQARPAQ